MSAERRGPTPAAPADDPTRIVPRNPITRADPNQDRRQSRPADRSSPHELPLSVRIERTRLRVRISALERLVARSETRRQAVIDQYERVLEDRDETAHGESTTASSWLFARLLRG